HASSAKDLTYPRDSGIVGLSKLLAQRIGPVHVHRTKFEEIEWEIVRTQPLLPEEHLPSTIQLNAECYEQHERQSDKQAEKSDYNIFETFQDNRRLVERLPHYAEGAKLSVAAAVEDLKTLVPWRRNEPQRNRKRVKATH